MCRSLIVLKHSILNSQSITCEDEEMMIAEKRTKTFIANSFQNDRNINISESTEKNVSNLNRKFRSKT